MTMNNKFYDESIEYGILGSIIRDPNLIIECNKIITENDLYFKTNKEIYKLINNYQKDNQKIDALIIHEKTGLSLDFLTNVLSTYAISCHIKEYSTLIKEKSNLRKIYSSAKNIINNIEKLDPKKQVDELLLECKQEFDIKLKEEEDKTIKDIAIDTIMQIEQRYNKSKIQNRLKDFYGLKWLDKNSNGSHAGEMTVLGARPSVGKTALALQMIINKAMHGGNVCFFSLEMSENSIFERFVSHMTNLGSRNLRTGNLTDEQWQELVSVSDRISDLEIGIFDKIHDIDRIKNKCRELNMKKKLDFIAVDYLQLIKVNEKTFSENHIISLISRELKLLALELNCPILVLSQLNRAIESRPDQRPSLADLRSSGSIEQDADNVFFLSQDNESESKIEGLQNIIMTIAKQRSGERFLEKKLIFNGQRYLFTSSD